MAKLSVNGLDELMLSLQEVADLPDDIAAAMLDAEAEVVEEFQMGSAATMLRGPYSTGQTASAIGRTKMKRGKDGVREVHVYPQGTNDKGERNATVAFVNEYGVPRRGIPARPFIATANAAAADPAVRAAEQIYDEFLKSKDL